MRQAGRYLDEYRIYVQNKTTLSHFAGLECFTVTLQPITRFGFDAAIIFSDILMVPWQ